LKPLWCDRGGEERKSHHARRKGNARRGRKGRLGQPKKRAKMRSERRPRELGRIGVEKKKNVELGVDAT